MEECPTRCEHVHVFDYSSDFTTGSTCLFRVFTDCSESDNVVHRTPSEAQPQEALKGCFLARRSTQAVCLMNLSLRSATFCC